MARKATKKSFKISLHGASYASEDQVATFRDSVELGTFGSFVYEGEHFELWEHKDEDDKKFIAIFGTVDGSGEHGMDFICEREAREMGFIA